MDPVGGNWVFDWKWLLLALPVVTGIVGRIIQMGKDLEKLRNQMAAFKADDTVQFPSDESEEAKAIKIAKALYKSSGERFTWAQAKKVAKHIREQQRRKEEKAQETSGGDGTKRTA